MFLHNEEGKICWKTNDMTGPFWNFSNTAAMDWFVEEIGGELTREADINMVFFDETGQPCCATARQPFAPAVVGHVPPAHPLLPLQTCCATTSTTPPPPCRHRPATAAAATATAAAAATWVQKPASLRG